MTFFSAVKFLKHNFLIGHLDWAVEVKRLNFSYLTLTFYANFCETRSHIEKSFILIEIWFLKNIICLVKNYVYFSKINIFMRMKDFRCGQKKIWSTAEFEPSHLSCEQCCPLYTWVHMCLCTQHTCTQTHVYTLCTHVYTNTLLFLAWWAFIKYWVVQ